MRSDRQGRVLGETVLMLLLHLTLLITAYTVRNQGNKIICDAWNGKSCCHNATFLFVNAAGIESSRLSDSGLSNVGDTVSVTSTGGRVNGDGGSVLTNVTSCFANCMDELNAQLTGGFNRLVCVTSYY
jgi:hypothetical protein